MRIGIRTTREFLKRDFSLSFYGSILLTIVYLLLIPVIRGISNLDFIQSASVLEQSVSLVGIILIVPITKWEHEMEIKELVLTKSWSYFRTVCLRLVISVFLTASMIVGFALVMQRNHCVFPLGSFVFGTTLISVFMGMFGLLLSQIGKNVIIGYLAALGYYSLCQLEIITEKSRLYLFPLTGGIFQKNSIFLVFILDIISLYLFIIILKKSSQI